MLVWNRPALLFVSLRLAAGAMGHGPEMFQTFNQQHNPLQKFGKIAKTYGALRQGLRWAPMGQPLKKTTTHFRTYFLYMIRYNNISRPVHDSNDPPATLPATPCPKSVCRDPQPPGLTPLDSNGKEAFSRRKELPWGGLRRMKMPQEKNGENTDLKCDLVLCRNKDYEKGGHHKIGSL